MVYPFAYPTGCNVFWCPEYEGDAEYFVVKGPGVFEVVVFEKFFAVVRGNEDDGIVQFTSSVEPFEEFTEGVVDEGELCIVSEEDIFESGFAGCKAIGHKPGNIGQDVFVKMEGLFIKGVCEALVVFFGGFIGAVGVDVVEVEEVGFVFVGIGKFECPFGEFGCNAAYVELFHEAGEFVEVVAEAGHGHDGGVSEVACGVACFFEGFGQGGALGVGARPPALSVGVGQGREAAEEAGDGLAGEGGLGVSLFVDDAFLGEGVDEGGGIAGVAVAAEVVGAEGIDGDDDDVGLAVGLCAAGEGDQEEKCCDSKAISMADVGRGIEHCISVPGA